MDRGKTTSRILMLNSTLFYCLVWIHMELCGNWNSLNMQVTVDPALLSFSLTCVLHHDEFTDTLHRCHALCLFSMCSVFWHATCAYKHITWASILYVFVRVYILQSGVLFYRLDDILKLHSWVFYKTLFCSPPMGVLFVCAL